MKESYNDYIIDLEAGLQKSINKELLIRGIFVLWYVIIEGVECSDFSESDLIKLLKRKIEFFKSGYSQDPDVLFIVGWTSHISFWYFGDGFDEESGVGLLRNAFKLNKTNSLFKWAVGGELRLKSIQIETLRKEVRSDFNYYYNFGKLIEDYFIRLL